LTDAGWGKGWCAKCQQIRRHKGESIDGTNQSTLNLGQVTEAGTGTYDVIVSNVVGPVTSSAAGGEASAAKSLGDLQLELASGAAIPL